VGLDLCITIRCGGLRFPFRVKPELDALLADEAGDVPVTAPKRLFAILDRKELSKDRVPLGDYPELTGLEYGTFPPE
jgi:hypothetical protein